MLELHGGSMASHYSENKTLIMLREHYYWPCLSKDQDILRGMLLVKWLRVTRCPMIYTGLYLLLLFHGLK